MQPKFTTPPDDLVRVWLELVDTTDLNPVDVSRAGSSPATRTKFCYAPVVELVDTLDSNPSA